jgi:hypothetical protein
MLSVDLDSGRVNRVPHLGLLLVSLVLIYRYSVALEILSVQHISTREFLWIVIEILGNTEPSAGEDFWSTASPSLALAACYPAFAVPT